MSNLVPWQTSGLNEEKKQLITRGVVAVTKCTGGELQNRVRTQAQRHAPGRHVALDLNDTILLVEVNKIERELHAECVHGLTGDNPKGSAGLQPLASQEALGAPRSGICYFY